MAAPLIIWFRQDLRLTDHSALLAALSLARETGAELVAAYILDDDTPGQWRAGGASRWWLHHSLASLDSSLRQLGGHLSLRRGDTHRELRQLVSETGAQQVFCSRNYEPWARDLEQRLHEDLGAQGVGLRRYPGALLFEPEAVRTGAGEPYKVFTPYWKACLRQPPPQAPRARPGSLPAFVEGVDSVPLQELELLPQAPNWAAGWDQLWQPGESGAAAALSRFLDGPLDDYDESRNHPDREATSRLSAHMHFGEISPRQLWQAIHQHCQSRPALDHQRDKFLSEMGWREFSHHLLHHFPDIPETAFKRDFDRFPWLGDRDKLLAWQRGLTGYPIVDAGMRELWQTGYMHNRVRMITASFLTKHLLVPWTEGERWFWDTLVDADLANNACGWQWVAGSGADAAPYFRIFNPTLQGKKFDSAGAYVRRWVPEIATLPDKYLHEPITAPAAALEAAGVVLGQTYPNPIVVHRDAREAALAAYGSLRA